MEDESILVTGFKIAEVIGRNDLFVSNSIPERLFLIRDEDLIVELKVVQGVEESIVGLDVPGVVGGMAKDVAGARLVG